MVIPLIANQYLTPMLTLCQNYATITRLANGQFHVQLACFLCGCASFLLLGGCAVSKLDLVF